MTALERATMPNYITLACETTLYAYNDYIRYSCDLFALENPDENDLTRRRFKTIVNIIKKEVIRNCRKTGIENDKARLLRFVQRELVTKKATIRGRAEVCREYFKDPHPLFGMLNMDGDRILHNADRLIDRWIAGETITLKKSCRGQNFDVEEEE